MSWSNFTARRRFIRYFKIFSELNYNYFKYYIPQYLIKSQASLNMQSIKPNYKSLLSQALICSDDNLSLTSIESSVTKYMESLGIEMFVQVEKAEDHNQQAKYGAFLDSSASSLGSDCSLPIARSLSFSMDNSKLFSKRKLTCGP